MVAGLHFPAAYWGKGKEAKGKLGFARANQQLEERLWEQWAAVSKSCSRDIEAAADS